MDWTKDKAPGGRDRGPTLRDRVEMLELEDGGDFKAVRMIGPSKRVAKHMLPVFKNDGTPVMKNGQQVKIPKVCLGYDSETGKTNEKKCPYCKMDPDPTKIEVQTNVIDRELQENFNRKKQMKRRTDKEKKRREMGDGKWFIAEDKSAKSRTPVRYMVIKSSVGGKISDYTALNKKKDKEGKVRVYAPNHPKYGFDLQMKFDKKKAGSEMYSCVKDDRKPLEEEELEYLLWSIDSDKPEKLEVAEKEAESFAKRMKAGAKKAGDSDDDDDDDDDRKKKKKGKKGKKSSAEDDDWDEDEDLEDDEDDGKKKKKKGKKSKDADDDDDDDDDDDEDDDRKKKKKKKKRDDDDDDDDDADDDDDDADEDEDEDDESDDEDEDDDDDDDDDEDSVKKKKKGKKDKGKSKKSKKDDDWDDDDDDDSSDDDDDDEDADDDDDDDDEDVKKKKKKGKKDKGKKKDKKKKKKSKDDDDDDWDDDDDDDDDD